jgi:hypothetical protein
MRRIYAGQLPVIPVTRPTIRRARSERGVHAQVAVDAAYSTGIPLLARLITSCWICSVPSKMS